MNKLKEGSILDKLINVNIDACHFYRQAARKSKSSRAEKSFCTLQKIHSEVVANLGIAAYKSGSTIPFKASGGEDAGRFGNLSRNSEVTPYACLVTAIEHAENDCLQMLEKAINSDDISIDIKMHVVGTVNLLQKSQQHISDLKETGAGYQQNSETNHGTDPSATNNP